MTKEEILKRVKKFQGANREFSQELPPIIEGLVDLIDEAGPEVVNNLTSNSPTKALSANMGKELKLMVDGKVSEPETAGTAGQILQLDEEGVPEWVDAAEVGATYDSTVSDTSTNAIQNKTIKKYVDDNFAQKDGYYASLTAGAAENIVGQSAIEGTFLFRTTAGDADISNGVATVEAVKGNTVAWNQLGVTRAEGSSSANNVTGTFDADGNLTIVVGTGGASGRWASLLATLTDGYITGHKYLHAVRADFTPSASTIQIGNNNYSWWNSLTYVWTAIGNEGNYSVQVVNGCAAGTYHISAPIIIDLTLMFGAGNEPSTVAVFESWLAANVGSKPYYPTSSKLLPTKLLKYVSRGFNQWDGQNTDGKVLKITGEEGTNASCFITDYIPVFPSTEYYFSATFALQSSAEGVCFYDANKNYISGSAATASTGFTKTTPANAAYLRAGGLKASVGTGVINLSWDGSRDGEYEPSEIHEYNLDVTKFYGKLNGEGDLTQIFPGGMRKADYAGTVRDLLSLKDAEADVKVGSVDLGTLGWSLSGYFYSQVIADLKAGSDNYICAKYVTGGYNPNPQEEKILYRSSGTLRIKDSAYSDAAAFKAAVTGVKLNYELATPLHYTDLVYRDNGVDTPVEALNVIVNNWSTEEEIIAAPEASGDPNSCAATLDILYGIDAAEQLDTINQSGIFTDDLKANLEALIGVINTNCATVLGGTLSISDTPTDKVYTFTFTPTSQGE